MRFQAAKLGRPVIANNMNLPYSLIGGAGVHHVVSELSRRGFVVLPTVRNVAAYDVIAATLDGKRHWKPSGKDFA